MSASSKACFAEFVLKTQGKTLSLRGPLDYPSRYRGSLHMPWQAPASPIKGGFFDESQLIRDGWNKFSVEVQTRGP